MMRFSIELAKQNDDAALQRILYENPIEGKIRLSFLRNPSYFHGLKTEGKFNQVVVARESENIVGLGSRSIRPVYINGRIQDIGYLNHLRLDKQYRGGLLIARGYRFLNELHKDKRAPAYLTTIVENNINAFRILIGKRAGLPCYSDLGIYYSFAIGVPFKKKKFQFSCDIEKGSESRLNEIIEFIHEQGPRKQFYPFYTKEDLVSGNSYLRDLLVSDFYLARKNNKIVGLLAKWNQSNFKQIAVRGYTGITKLLRPMYNIYALSKGLPRLPPPSFLLNFFYISFITVNSDEPSVFKELIQFICNDSIGSGYSYFVLGLHSADPLIKGLDSFRMIKYKSRVFLVFWEDGEEFFKSLDNRVPHLEIGTL